MLSTTPSKDFAFGSLEGLLIKGNKGVVYVDIYDKGEKEHTEKVDVYMKDGKWCVDHGFKK